MEKTSEISQAKTQKPVNGDVAFITYTTLTVWKVKFDSCYVFYILKEKISCLNACMFTLLYSFFPTNRFFAIDFCTIRRYIAKSKCRIERQNVTNTLNKCGIFFSLSIWLGNLLWHFYVWILSLHSIPLSKFPPNSIDDTVKWFYCPLQILNRINYSSPMPGTH